MRELLQALGGLLAAVPNRLTLEGHTDAASFSAGERGYSNWELSADRANASRREMLLGALPEGQVLRVQGLASSVLQVPADPRSSANRRISIIVMNRDAEERALRGSLMPLEAATPEVAPAPAPQPAAPPAAAPSSRPEPAR